jgi:glycosyltransferase involved in cell wall biosynthesis
LRVAHITPRYFPNIGGIEGVVKELSERFVQEGHSVSVYTLDWNNKLRREEHVKGVLVKRYKPLIADPLFFPSFNFLMAIRNDDATILHIHNIHVMALLFVALLKKPNQRLIVQPHYHRFAQTKIRDLFFAFYKRLLAYVVLPRADAIIFNSSYEKKIFHEDFPQNREATLIPQGINIDELKLIEWRPDYPRRILYVGGLRKYKNVDKLLQAFSLILDQKIKDLKLVIVGDGPEKRSLVELSHKLGIENYVEWKHNLTRKQLILEYARARIFISISALESFGRTGYEAIAIGVPTIVLKVGASAELVQKNLAEGLTSNRPKEIAEVISEALTEHKKVETKNVSKIFRDWDDYHNDLKKVYGNVAKC